MFSTTLYIFVYLLFSSNVIINAGFQSWPSGLVQQEDGWKPGAELEVDQPRQIGWNKIW